MGWFRRKKPQPPACPHEWLVVPPQPPVHFMRKCVKCGVYQGSPIAFERLEKKDEPRQPDH